METYNGWINRETWALALHMSNDQSLDELCSDWATRAVELVRDDDETTGSLRSAKNRAGDMLRDWAENLWEETLQSDTAPQRWAGLMVSDVGSLWRVDFSEIMDGYVSDAQERS